MALETVVFQQDPFSYGCKDYYNIMAAGGGGGHGAFGGYGLEERNINMVSPPPAAPGLLLDHQRNIHDEQLPNSIGYWDSPPPSSVAQSLSKDWDISNINNNNNSSPEITCGGDGFFSGGALPLHHHHQIMGVPAASGAARSFRQKRRRTKSLKNKEEMENQRMTHIAVERNRRRQMNDYLAVLRSLMPPSYAQRGDQASIVGGAINFVKELEQLLQVLEANKHVQQQPASSSALFSNFFTFPQYTTCPTRHNINDPTMASSAVDATGEKQSTLADIEVTMVESYANIKLLSRRRPKQLLKMVTGFQSMSLTILHLNITTVEDMVLYSFNVKVEDDCQVTTVNEIATAVHEMVGMIQEDSISS